MVHSDDIEMLGEEKSDEIFTKKLWSHVKHIQRSTEHKASE